MSEYQRLDAVPSRTHSPKHNAYDVCGQPVYLRGLDDLLGIVDTKLPNVAPGSSTNPVAPTVGTADQRDEPKAKPHRTEQEERS